MNAKDTVEQILKDHPEARDSDKKLFYWYFKECLGWGLQEYHLKQLLESAYSLETLRRARQLIQNEEGKLQAKEEVQKHRQAREEMISADVSNIWKDARTEGEA
ncbi:MAG: hypothetical protein ACOC5D_07050 [Thermoplasmatota archaeon]